VTKKAVVSATSNRKRLLVLTSTFPRWEGDREPPFVFELSRRLAREFDVAVLAPHARGASRHEEMAGLEVFRFPYFFEAGQTLAYNGGILANLKARRRNYLLVPFFALGQLIQLIRIIRTMQVDAIHAHWIIPQGLIALVARVFARRGSRPAIICTSHGGDLFGLSGKLFGAVKKSVIARVERLTVVSQAMRSFAQTLVPRSDIEVIPMGVDLAGRFTAAPEVVRNSDQILFVGRLVEKKGIRYLIEAMPRVVASYPAMKLDIAGEGPDKARLQQLVQSLGLAGAVNFLGPVDQDALREQYRRATVFVAPSVIAQGGDQEGLGLVFVEALGCECPVIASDLPAIGDVIKDSETGLICRQNDSGDLADKILYLLERPELRRSLGENGRRYVAGRFDWEIIAQRYADLIRESIGSAQ
jgi:glycosyltransferase involved in cell wall biosynthesis